MDPIMLKLGPLTLHWYGFLIAMGALIGSYWSLSEARKRDLDEDKLLDMTLWLVIAGLIGARLVYVLTSPAAYFGPGGQPLDAIKIWQGGGSIHGGILGVVVAVWLYSRRYGLNMWSYLDVLTPIGALGVIGGRLGNIMNGSDTTGRMTGWPLGFTWPEPGTRSLGAFGDMIFGKDMWAYAPQVEVGGRTLPGVYGPVHFTQLYGVFIGVALVFILLWAFRRSRAPGFVWWQFVLWYSVLRSVVEETFRYNPLPWKVFLSEGPNAAGIGLFTLTQLVSVPLIILALFMLSRIKKDQPEKRVVLINKASRH